MLKIARLALIAASLLGFATAALAQPSGGNPGGGPVPPPTPWLYAAPIIYAPAGSCVALPQAVTGGCAFANSINVSGDFYKNGVAYSTLFLQKANNLSDVANASTSINNLFGGQTGTGGAVRAIAPAVTGGFTSDGYKASSGITITEATTARTLASGDNGKIIITTNSSPVTITVPSGLGAGFSCLVIQNGAGQVGFAASGTTINSYNSLVHIVGQFANATLIETAADVLTLAGNLQ